MEDFGSNLNTMTNFVPNLTSLFEKMKCATEAEYLEVLKRVFLERTTDVPADFVPLYSGCPVIIPKKNAKMLKESSDPFHHMGIILFSIFPKRLLLEKEFGEFDNIVEYLLDYNKTMHPKILNAIYTKVLMKFKKPAIKTVTSELALHLVLEESNEFEKRPKDGIIANFLKASTSSL